MYKKIGLGNCPKIRFNEDVMYHQKYLSCNQLCITRIRKIYSILSIDFSDKNHHPSSFTTYSKIPSIINSIFKFIKQMTNNVLEILIYREEGNRLRRNQNADG